MKKAIIFILSLCFVLSLSACDAADDVFSFEIENKNTPNQSSKQGESYEYIIDEVESSSQGNDKSASGAQTIHDDKPSKQTQTVVGSSSQQTQTDTGNSSEQNGKPTSTTSNNSQMTNTTNSSEKTESNGSSNNSSSTSSSNENTSEPVHTHSYSKATCTTQPTCSCGAVRGAALGHDYSEDPIKCQRCAEILELKVDDKIKFGKYDWYVLEVTSDKAFLLCRSCVGTSGGLGGTWENSDVRTYLNNDFYNGFSAACKNRILSVEIKNPNNPNGVSGGNPTVDKIFLLSYEEFNQYLTPSIASLGVDWWLRTPGSRTSYNYTTDYYTAYVENDGTLTLDGLFVFSTGYLRPAMWIDLS